MYVTSENVSFASSACDNNVYIGSVGNMTSPKYPSAYDDYLNCSNVIWAPQRSHFYLNVEWLNMAYHDFCLYDWIEVFNSFK